jgi:hypothetical protein
MDSRQTRLSNAVVAQSTVESSLLAVLCRSPLRRKTKVARLGAGQLTYDYFSVIVVFTPSFTVVSSNQRLVTVLV